MSRGKAVSQLRPEKRASWESYRLRVGIFLSRWGRPWDLRGISLWCVQFNEANTTCPLSGWDSERWDSGHLRPLSRRRNVRNIFHKSEHVCRKLHANWDRAMSERFLLRRRDRADRITLSRFESGIRWRVHWCAKLHDVPIWKVLCRSWTDRRDRRLCWW